MKKKARSKNLWEYLKNYPIYEELAEAYNFYSKELFGGVLPQCIILLSKKVNNFGYFMPLNYISIDGADEKKHEIALNVQMFTLRDIKLTLSTLVHEMYHLKTFEDGDYGRGNYHNKKWAELMKSVGLILSTTGEAGEREIGQSVSHYIEAGGLFEKVTRELLKDGFLITFVERLGREIKSFSIDEIKKKAIKERQ